jgi:two-component system phosphate regulon sensor histidine kinase PhoR
MFQSIRWKITVTYFSLFILNIIILSGILAKVLENYFTDSLIASLTTETVIAQQFVQNYYPENTAELDHLVKNLGAAINTRITVIDPAGKVLGDSEKNISLMENHRQRPEFMVALAGQRGVTTRYSSTVNESMTYVALPLRSGDEIIGAVRLSIPLTQVHQTLREIHSMLLAAVLVATAIFIILSLRLASVITGPLEQLTRSAKRIAFGDLKHRNFNYAQGEIGELQQAINFMAEKQQEKIGEINDQKSKLMAVLEHMTSGIIVFNQQGNITLVNPAAEKLLNIKAAKTIGKSYLAVLRNQDMAADLDKVLTQGKVLSKQVHLEQPAELFLQIVLAPVYHHREIKEGVMVLTDITTIKQLEKLRSQFVANVSHELRTPLTSIKGFVETLQSGAACHPETRERFLGIIASETERLSRLIEDILELSKIEAYKANLELTSVSLRDLVCESVQQLAETAEKKGLTLSSAFQDDFQVAATRDGLKQVLLNLLQNAINYTPEGGKIEVSVKEYPRQVVVRISDTGIGIPAADLPRIFERFYRVDKARSREAGGTGLGLSIVKHLIESFGGSVWAESKPGKGSTFYFSLAKAQLNA